MIVNNELFTEESKQSVFFVFSKMYIRVANSSEHFQIGVSRSAFLIRHFCQRTRVEMC